MLRILFMGTPDFATACLKKLTETKHNIVGVVTQPDKLVGRKKELTPSPVKECALKHNLKIFQPTKIRLEYQEIMDLNISLRAMEEQNKNRFPVCVMERRKHFGAMKTNSKIAHSYYKNMPNVHKTGYSYFVDEKN